MTNAVLTMLKNVGNSILSSWIL